MLGGRGGEYLLRPKYGNLHILVPGARNPALSPLNRRPACAEFQELVLCCCLFLGRTFSATCWLASANIVRFRPVSAGVGPISAKLGLGSGPSFGREVVRVRPSLARVRSSVGDCGRSWPNFGHELACFASVGRILPKLVLFRRTLPELDQNLGVFSPKLTLFSQHQFVRFRVFWFARFGTEFDAIAT